MNPYTRLLAVVTAALAATPFAHAIPQLRIFDGITTITVSDNAAGDSSGATGRIVWNGTIGNWTFNTDVGTTSPIIGSVTNPQLDLSFNAVSNGAGGTIVISFSENGFGPSAGFSFASIGGVTQGTVNYQTFGGTNNTLLSTSTLLSSQGPFTGAFSGAVSGSGVSNGGPYSLTQMVTITHAANGITTGNVFLSVPDSGDTALLLGAVLASLGFVGRLQRMLVS
jgi:hypothetical protein